MKQALKVLAARSPVAQRLYRAYRRHQQEDHVFDWTRLLKQSHEWAVARAEAAAGPRMLIATSVGGIPTAPLMDSLLAVALTLRGAHVELLLCDAAMPACLMSEVGLFGPDDLVAGGNQRYLCRHCYQPAARIFEPLGLPVRRYSEFLHGDEHRSLSAVEIAEHAQSGALRYFAAADLPVTAVTDAVRRAYEDAALIARRVIDGALDQIRPDFLSCMNGIYVPHGVVMEAARARGIRTVTYNVAYRKQSFLFSHGDTYHHTLMSEPTATWENLEFPPSIEQTTMEYLQSRRRGGRDWIVFHSSNPVEAREQIASALPTIDFNRPIIGLLTNVAWDAQLHYPANAFPSMMAWVHATIDYFASHPELQLVLRIHPAEKSGDIPSRQPVAEEIRKRWPTLPANIAVVLPESNVSTYGLMELCDSVLVYGTKTGVELTARGIPVIVAGEAWIRNKGLTRDVSSAYEYQQALAALPSGRRLDAATVRRARKYAYHFFFRRMIPVSSVVPTGSEPQFRIAVDSLDALRPGVDPGLDVICEGILNGTPFVYPAEKYETNLGAL